MIFSNRSIKLCFTNITAQKRSFPLRVSSVNITESKKSLMENFIFCAVYVHNFRCKIKFSSCFHQVKVESSNLVYLSNFWSSCLKSGLFHVIKLWEIFKNLQKCWKLLMTLYLSMQYTPNFAKNVLQSNKFRFIKQQTPRCFFKRGYIYNPMQIESRTIKKIFVIPSFAPRTEKK